MTGHNLILALGTLSPEQLDHPVVLEQHPHYNLTLRACKAVIYDPELKEVVLLCNGPFDNKTAGGL